jgi:hypothetical protein
MWKIQARRGECVQTFFVLNLQFYVERRQVILELLQGPRSDDCGGDASTFCTQEIAIREGVESSSFAIFDELVNDRIRFFGERGGRIFSPIGFDLLSVCAGVFALRTPDLTGI